MGAAERDKPTTPTHPSTRWGLRYGVCSSMEDQATSVEDRVRAAQVEARARHISHNVRCLECGHQSIEESAADIAVRLRKVLPLPLSPWLLSFICLSGCSLLALPPCPAGHSRRYSSRPQRQGNLRQAHYGIRRNDSVLSSL